LKGLELFSSQDFREVVSGKRKGPLATLIRVGLSLAEIPYTFAVRIRNRHYDLVATKSHRVSVPVICIGNLTMGGTGKTPMVHFLAKLFQQRGIRMTIVSRGYRSAADDRNDEAKELSEKLPAVSHIQNPDRLAAAHQAIEKCNAQVIVLDDGFQHRRLARDLDVVLIDALEPFGFGRVFPRGMLREPVEGLKRAQVVGLSRANLISTNQRAAIRQRVQKVSPDACWIELAHSPRELKGRTSRRNFSDLKGRRILAFCGIGNPVGFRSTLESCGAIIVGFREFPDHHAFSRDDVEALRTWAKENDSDMVVCTHKDLVKLDIDDLAEMPLFALLVELKLLKGRSQFIEHLESIAQAASSQP